MHDYFFPNHRPNHVYLVWERETVKNQDYSMLPEQPGKHSHMNVFLIPDVRKDYTQSLRQKIQRHIQEQEKKRPRAISSVKLDIAAPEFIPSNA